MLPQTIAILSSDRKKIKKVLFAGRASLSSWVLIFISQKSSQTGWGAGSASPPSTPSAAVSVPSSAASSSSGRYAWCLALAVGVRSNELLACWAVRVSSLQEWVLLSPLPRVSDWRADKQISTTASRLASPEQIPAMIMK